MSVNNKAVVNSDENNVWHILVHPHPLLMDKLFRTKQSESFNPLEDDGLLPPCEYSIPFIEINWRPARTQQPSEDWDDKAYDPILDGNAFRRDFHSFIFVLGTGRLIQRILNSKLNRSLQTPIRLYHDTYGQPIRISREEMSRFKSAVMRQDFQICNGYLLQEITKGDKVKVVVGPMKGSVGEVVEIRFDQQGMKLKIAFMMFNDNLQIAIPGFRFKDVSLFDPEAKQLLQDPLIANFEEELIELLHHRHGAKGSATLSPEDQKRLKFLYHYSDIVFEEDAVSTAKFAALMLICIYLLKDKEAISQHIQEVEGYLSKEDSPLSTLPSSLSAELECYLTTALFIATHNPALRTAAKLYRKTHPDCPEAICRFLSIAKKI